MRLPAGARLGRYEVVGHIGSGGMGDVYRARDTHLERPVALKTIATAYAPDPSAQPRFERERRLMATLEHPHICRLLDAGREAGIDYLAMELLEGESLAARLKRGPLPVPAAIGCAIEIADALAYAHQHGIVHRDLKPANVFLTPTGARVLDFGLAKLRPAAAAPSASAAAAQGDTVPLDGTQAGTLVGSANYMAPERLEGGDADHRTDIFGFGLILYEMLTARAAFAGRSAAAIIAAILSSEPAPLGLDHPKAPELDWIVRRCLDKDPNRRWQSMGDVQALLRRLASHEPAAARPAPERSLRRHHLVLTAAGLLLAVSAAGLGWLLAERRAARQAPAPLAFTVNPPLGGAFAPTEGSLRTAQLALSPDGRSLVYVAADSDRVVRLWVRPFSSVRPDPLPGTEDATFPFWSPDGRHLGFFSRGFLRTVDLEGGPPRQLARAENGRGGSWNAAGEILFSPDTSGPLLLVDPVSGSTREATSLDAAREESSHRWPIFLPDGLRFLFFARSTARPDQQGVYLSSLDGAPARLVVRSDAGGALQPPDRLLYVENGTLLSMRFDAGSGTPLERPVAMAEGVGTSSNNYAAISGSRAATIAYASTALMTDLVWYDRGGQRDTLAAMGQHVDFRLSPDGSAVAIAEVDRESNRADVFVMNLNRPGPKRRITHHPATDASPVWSPDGKRLVFRSNRERIHDLYVAPALSGPPQLFLKSADAKYPTSWVGTAELMAFHAHHDTTNWDVHVASTRAGGGTRAVLDTRFNEIHGQLSSDGRFLAYASDVTGVFEVYVKELTSGATEPVSVQGGLDPRWRGDGRELFYLTPTGALMAAAIDYRGEQLQPSAPTPLFEIGAIDVTAPYTSPYDVSADGQRFLVRIAREDVGTTPLTVVTQTR